MVCQYTSPSMRTTSMAPSAARIPQLGERPQRQARLPWSRSVGAGANEGHLAVGAMSIANANVLVVVQVGGQK
jgi:hypothetical protein